MVTYPENSMGKKTGSSFYYCFVEVKGGEWTGIREEGEIRKGKTEGVYLQYIYIFTILQFIQDI